MGGGEPWGQPETPPKTKQKNKWDRADDQIAQFDFMCARHDAPQPSASHDTILETPKKSSKVSAGLRPSTCFHGWTCFCILICFMCFRCFQYFSIRAKGCKRHNGGEYDWNWLNTMSLGEFTNIFQQLLLDPPCLSQRAVGFGWIWSPVKASKKSLCQPLLRLKWATGLFKRGFGQGTVPDSWTVRIYFNISARAVPMLLFMVCVDLLQNCIYGSLRVFQCFPWFSYNFI